MSSELMEINSGRFKLKYCSNCGLERDSYKSNYNQGKFKDLCYKCTQKDKIISKSKYIGYESCPKCGKKGSISMYYRLYSRTRNYMGCSKKLRVTHEKQISSKPRRRIRWYCWNHYEEFDSNIIKRYENFLSGLKERRKKEEKHEV